MLDRTISFSDTAVSLVDTQTRKRHDYGVHRFREAAALETFASGQY